MWVLSKRWWVLSLALLVPGVIALIIGLISPGFKTDDGMSLWKFGILWIAIMLVVHAGLFVWFYLQARRARYFAQYGIPATATILKADTTGTTVNDCPEIELQLEVAIPGEAPYPIKHKECFNPLTLAGLQRGAQMNVLVDPRHRNRIMLRYDAGEQSRPPCGPGARRVG